MSARRNFLKDITLAIAASLVPRILQPAVPEVQDETVNVEFEFKYYYFEDNKLFPAANVKDYPFTLQMKVSDYELIKDQLIALK